MATRIAGFPASGIAHVKALVNQVAPASADALIEESQRFSADMNAASTRERVQWLMDNGGQTDSAIERDLGAQLGRYPEPL